MQYSKFKLLQFRKSLNEILRTSTTKDILTKEFGTNHKLVIKKLYCHITLLISKIVSFSFLIKKSHTILVIINYFPFQTVDLYFQHQYQITSVQPHCIVNIFCHCDSIHGQSSYWTAQLSFFFLTSDQHEAENLGPKLHPGVGFFGP